MEAELNGIKLIDVPPHLMRDDLERRLPCGRRFECQIGNRYGTMTVVGFAGFLRQYAVYLIQCDCGKQYLRRSNFFMHKGSSTPTRPGDRCKCQRMDGRCKHPLRMIWNGIKVRCYRKSDPSYANYGARGIYMCDRWRKDFWAFVSDMGERPSDKHSIDRIDNDGPYSPDNCRWATQKEQANNTRHNRWIEHNGERRTHSGWAIELGITRERLRQRVNALEAIGADVTEAITTPPGETMPSLRGSQRRRKSRCTLKRRENSGMKDQWFEGNVMVLKSGKDFQGSPESLTAALRVESSIRGGKSKTRSLGEYVLFQHRTETILQNTPGEPK